MNAKHPARCPHGFSTLKVTLYAERVISSYDALRDCSCWPVLHPCLAAKKTCKAC